MNTDVEHKRLSLWQDYLLDSFKSKNTCVQRCDPCHGSSPARLARPSHRRLQCACRHYFLPRQASVCKPFYQPVVNAGGHQAYFRQRMRPALISPRACSVTRRDFRADGGRWRLRVDFARSNSCFHLVEEPGRMGQ